MDKLPKTKNSSSPTVPFSLRILKRCVEYGISFDLAKHLHLYDLQCLLIQFDIQKIQDYLKNEEQRKLSARGIKEVRDIDGSEAIKFLGR